MTQRQREASPGCAVGDTIKDVDLNAIDTRAYSVISPAPVSRMSTITYLSSTVPKSSTISRSERGCSRSLSTYAPACG